MPKVYDDWERLVRATIRREEIWQLCHDHSRTPSSGSTTSGSSPGSSSPAPDNRQKTRASPLRRQSGAVPNRVVSSTPLSSLNPQNQRGIKNESMRRSKSRMRLDRWVWSRWLSNAFTTHKTGHA